MSVLKILMSMQTGSSSGTVTPPATTFNVMAEGDSLTADETREGFLHPWIYWLEQSLNNSEKYVSFKNFATAGNSVLGAMDQPAQLAEVLAGMEFDVTKNILFLFIGVNDVQRDGQNPDLTQEEIETSAQFIYNDCVSLSRYYRDRGIRVAIGTLLPPRSAAWTDAQTAVMRDIAFELNDIIRSGFNTDCKATVLCDIQTDPEMGQYESNRDYPQHFQPDPDRLHWTSDSGAQRMARFPLAAMPYLEAGTVATIEYNNLP